ncbi:esterase family protein [Curtobacterium sp. BH-2-1-1]|uniref:alpha/beta hydrolase n=1 Tax=Curtobacterium sp. BH-2-1-1 TaxID=1905847 RepID=UPI001642827E|nr:alpha/beta hydrolase-fold protein [Curtobacterium sp. BH-2-1-1]
MQHALRPGRTVWTVLVVVLALTVVNVGVGATWWSRASADPTAAVTVTATPTPAVTPTPTVLPDPVGSDGIPLAEHPSASQGPATLDLAHTWAPRTDLPTAGRLLHVTIPATRSHFTARPGLLWLPPAALVPDPPALPVVVLLPGQSRGSGPEDLETGGHLTETMDAVAAMHAGLAPIVVVPDQLGPDSGNPMCVDGPLGNSRTYLEQDVPAWITSHLRVQTGASAWTIGGFSQGGTCAIQLGAGDPGRFGNIIDVSGELGPTLGSPGESIARGFSGNAAAYRAAQPEALLAAHGPYRDSSAFFTAAQLDGRYGPAMPVVAAHAAAAGMHVTTWVIPGVKHNWLNARTAIAAGMAWLVPRIGLAPGP